MGYQHPVPHKFQELRKHLLDAGRAHQHFIRDSGQLHNLPIQLPPRIHKGLEPVNFLPIFEDYRTDFNNPVRPGAEARGLQIECRVLLVEVHLLTAVNHNPVIHIVYIISLAAVKNFDVLVGACHLCLGSGLHGVREGLGYAVIGDGNCPVSPGSRLLHSIRGGREGVHIAHGCVQMQLHPLLPGGRILPFRHGAGTHGVGFQYHFILETILDQLSLYPKYAAHLYMIQNGLCLPGLHEFGDPDGVGVVGNIELGHPCVALFQFFMVNGKDAPLHDNGTHIQVQLPHGNRISFERLSIEGVAGNGLGLLTLFRLCRHGGKGFQHCAPHGLHGVKQRLPGQIPAGLDLNRHRACKFLPKSGLHLGNQSLQGLLSVGAKLNIKLGFLPCPLCPRQGSPCHGVPAHKEPHQLLRFHAVKLGFRMGRRNFQAF